MEMMDPHACCIVMEVIVALILIGLICTIVIHLYVTFVVGCDGIQYEVAVQAADVLGLYRFYGNQTIPDWD